MNIFNPFEWEDPSGYLDLIAVLVGSLVLVVTKLAGTQWDDWLDERIGRGSIKDEWPFDRKRL